MATRAEAQALLSRLGCDWCLIPAGLVPYAIISMAHSISNGIPAGVPADEGFDGFIQGKSLDGQGTTGEKLSGDGEGIWLGPMVDRSGYLGLQASDDMEYHPVEALNGHDYGAWSGEYVDRGGDLWLRSLDTMESYTPASAVNGLTGGSDWSGPYVDR
jgi:hypothetical protein